MALYITGKHGTISLFRKSDFLQNVTVFPCAEYVGLLICKQRVVPQL